MEFIFADKSELKKFSGKAIANCKVVPQFSKLHTDKDIEFIMYHSHEFFDGLIDFHEIQKFNLSNDLVFNLQINKNMLIPFHFRALFINQQMLGDGYSAKYFIVWIVPKTIDGSGTKK